MPELQLSEEEERERRTIQAFARGYKAETGKAMSVPASVAAVMRERRTWDDDLFIEDQRLER